MPHSESALYERISEINWKANHQRGLRSGYGYNSILDIDLVERCSSLRRQFDPPIRLLDIGCGSGKALAQLAVGLERVGANLDEFELWGLGPNRYDEMDIDESRFIESGLNAYVPDGTRFHGVVSVFAFHYIWHKLEGLEKIYNDLLVDGGFASIHFPGYLVRFCDSPTSLVCNEGEGNQTFAAFLEAEKQKGTIVPMEYRLIPYTSDDDDGALLGEFGRLQFRREAGRRLEFDLGLAAFGLFTEGFNFSRMDGKLTYVCSNYERAESPEHREQLRSTPTYRLTSTTSVIPRRSFTIDVAVHAHASDRVVLICPGAYEPLRGKLMDPVSVANQVLAADIGAAVRYGDPYDDEGDYAELTLAVFRSMIELISTQAERFCATSTPRISVMAYSSSAGAAAALAADYPAIDGLLLVAPSLDVPRGLVEPGLARFTGDVRVLIGSADEVVLPQQAFSFYEAAVCARHREYVEVPDCGHYFTRPHHRSIFRRSPEWAFGGRRPADFPPSMTWCTRAE